MASKAGANFSQGVRFIENSAVQNCYAFKKTGAKVFIQINNAKIFFAICVLLQRYFRKRFTLCILLL